jgi:hypothetical protein
LILRWLLANTRSVRKARALLILFALSAAACGKEIGDECKTNVDCAQDGTRDCDLSQPGGYCTVNGCDEKSCPSGSTCIRVFPYEESGASPCTWPPPDRCSLPSDSSAQLCAADQICIPEGFCVPRTSERRFCAKSCSGNGDCRGGYVCREAGIECKTASSNTYGSLALAENPASVPVARFCAPATP